MPFPEAVILAGGLGTRLRSVVSDLPKPMAPVAGRPFLCYLLDHLQRQGIRRVVLSTGYRHEAFERYFGTSYGDIDVEYSVEAEPLGTGGGLRQALSRIDGDSCFALNGDTFLALDYRKMNSTPDLKSGADMLVVLRQVEDASRYGRVRLEGGRIAGFDSDGSPGPGLINAGVYWLTRDVFKRYPMPDKFSFERDFLEAHASQIRPAAYVSDAPFIDIGVPQSLADAQTLLPSWTGRQP